MSVLRILIADDERSIRLMLETGLTLNGFRVTSTRNGREALAAMATGKFDAVICLGVIIRGETPHFHYIAAETARGIGEANLRTGVPLLFGVITADNVQQAMDRAGAKPNNKGFEAAMAAVEIVNLYQKEFGIEPRAVASG